jgi:hypothetical protein
VEPANLYEGRVIRAILKVNPKPCVEFRIDGHDVTLVVPHRPQQDPKAGDSAYVIGRDVGEGKAVVLGMLLGEPGKTISETAKFALCKRLGFSTFGERVLRSCFERIETDYLKAVKHSLIDPAVMVDARTDEHRRRRLDPVPDPEGLPRAYIRIKVDARSKIAQEVRVIDPEAGALIAADPDPKSPFTIVVLSDGGIVEIFQRPEPK